MTRSRAPSRAAVLVATSLLVVACGADSDGERTSSGGAARAESAESTGACALVDGAAVHDAFATEVVTEEQPIEGHCFFAFPRDSNIPNAGVTVLRNELGQVLWDEWADEVESSAYGSGGSGLVDVDLGDEALAHPGPNAVDLIVRDGDVNVRITAEVSSDGARSGDALLAAATMLAEHVL